MKSAVDNQDLVLENDRVKMRLLMANDLEHLLPFAEHEPELWKYSLMSAGSRELMEKYISFAVQKMEELSQIPFIVFDKKLNRYAGCTRFYNIDFGQKNMLLGYTWYGKNFQGTGLNKNCKYLLLQYAFEQMEMERIEFRADNTNERSKAAMRSIGAIEEGILRSDSYDTSGGRRNSIVLSILKDEWFSTVKNKLEQKL